MNRIWIAGTLAFTLAGIAAADEWNKKTDITVKETILIPGKQLPPGKYVMKLADSSSNRHIVQIFNEDQTELEATIMAFNNEQVRPDPDGKTVLTYWETPAGSPPALRAWFYPGDTWGQEFAYPKQLAEQLAAVNHTGVPSYDPAKVNGTPTADSLKQMETPAGQAQPSSAAAAVRTPLQPVAPADARPPDVNAAPDRTANRTAAAGERNEEPALVAQNTPPASQPNREPQLIAQAQPRDNQADVLPQTSTAIPMVILAGLTLLAVGSLLSFRGV